MCWTAIALVPTKPALSFIPQNRGGDLGISHFTAANPPVGAQITFNLQDAVTTKLAERQRRDRAAIARGETPPYPTHEQLRAEAEKEAPATIVSIADSAGKVIRRLDAPAGRGLQRITWDILAQSTQLAPAAAVAGGGGRGGALVVPGKYTVSLARRVDGVITPLPGTQTLEVAAEDPATKEDRVAMADFHEKLGRLQKAPTTTTQSATEAGTRLSAIRRAIDATPSLPSRLREETLKLEKQLNQDQHHAQRRPRLARHQRRRPGIHLRSVQSAASPTRGTTGRPTKTAIEQYQIASDDLALKIPKLRKLFETDIKALEKQLDAAGAPPTPGRPPEWKGGK